MVNYREVTVEDLDEKRAQIADLKRQVEESQKSSAKIKQQIEQYKRKMDRMFMELVQKNKDSIEQAKDRMGQLEQDIARQTAIIENNPSHLEQAEKKLSELEHMCLEKRSEADALAQLEVGEDVKGIDIINAQLQTSTVCLISIGLGFWLGLCLGFDFSSSLGPGLGSGLSSNLGFF